MPITGPVVGTITTQATSTTLIGVAYPPSVAAGDLLVLFVASSTTTAPPVPSGWLGASLLNGGPAPGTRIAYKFATGSESGSLSVGTPGGTSRAVMLAFKGVDPTTPLDVAATTGQASTGSSYLISSLTTTRPGVALVVFGVALAGGGTWTAPTTPSGFTENAEAPPTSVIPSFNASTNIWSSSGATGVMVVARSTSAAGGGIAIALRPAPTATAATPSPATDPTVTAFAAPAVRIDSPAVAAVTDDTVAGFDAPAVATDSAVSAATDTTVTAFDGPAVATTSAAAAATLAGAAVVGAPVVRAGAGVAAAVLARAAAFGAPALSMGSRPTPATLARPVAFPASGASASSRPTPSTDPTTTGFGPPTLAASAGAEPTTLATATGFAGPLPRAGQDVEAVTFDTGSRVNDYLPSQAWMDVEGTWDDVEGGGSWDALGDPAVLTVETPIDAAPTPATWGTSVVVQVPGFATVEGAPTHSTAAAVGSAAVSTSAVAVPPPDKNLVLNGDGSRGDLTNFPGWTAFVPGPDGGFLHQGTSATLLSGELMAVDPTLSYPFAAEWRGDPGAGQMHYVGFNTYDAQGNAVAQTNNWGPYGATTLAADLAPGDTQLELVSSAGWQNAVGQSASSRNIGIFPYVDPAGREWTLADGYTRHVVANGWDAGAIVGNTMTLRVPWNLPNPDRADGVWPAGTQIANTGGGSGTYLYNLASAQVLNDDLWRSGRTTILPTLGGGTASPTARFRPGTAYIRVLVLANYQGSTVQRTLYRNFELIDPRGSLPTQVGFGLAAPKISAGVRPVAATQATAAGFAAPGMSTGWRVTAATLARAAAFPTPGLSTGWRVAAATDPTTTTFPTPGLSTGWRVAAATDPTTTAFGAPGLSTGTRPAPATLARAAAVGAPTAKAGAGATPATVATAAGFGDPAELASATPDLSLTWATVAAFGDHAEATWDDLEGLGSWDVVEGPWDSLSLVISTGSTATPESVATSSGFDGPAFSTSWQVAAATLAQAAAFPVPGLSASTRPAPATDTTTTGFGAPGLATGVRPAPATDTTTTGFPAPALSAGTRPAPATDTTSTGFSAPALSTGWSVAASTDPTSTGFPAPALSTGSRNTPATLARAAAFPAPTAKAGAGASPATVATSAGFGDPVESTDTTPDLPLTLATAATFGDRTSVTWDELETLGSWDAVEGFWDSILVISTGSTASPVSLGTVSSFAGPGLASAAGVDTLDTAAVVGAPRLSAIEVPATHATAVAFPPTRLASSPQVAPLTLTAAFGAPAVTTTALVVASPLLTVSAVSAPLLSATSRATPVVRATSTGFGVPGVVAVSVWPAPTHATVAVLGVAAVSAGSRTSPATLARPVAFGAPAVAASGAVPVGTVATSSDVAAVAPSTDWIQSAVTHATAAAIYVPATSSRAFPVPHGTATGFGAPSLSTGGRAVPPSLARVAVVGVPGLSTGALLAAATLPTAATVGVPVPRGGAGAVPGTHGSLTGFPAVALSSRELPATLATAATVWTPRSSAGSVVDTHATAAEFGVPSLHGVEGATTLAGSVAFGAPVVRAGAGARPGTLVTQSTQPELTERLAGVSSEFDSSGLFTEPAPGEFRTAVQSGSVFNDSLIEINPAAPVVLEQAASWRGDPGVGQRHYIGLACYDFDGTLISNPHINRVSGAALAVLTADLAPGDTVMELSTTAGWYAGATAHARAVVLFPYITPSGHRYDIEDGYSRNLAQDNTNGVWASGAFAPAAAPTTVPLLVPWSRSNPNRKDGVWPAGTPVANHQSGGTYNYSLVSNGLVADNAWQSLGPVQVGPPVAGPARTDRVWAGTRYVRWMLLTNRDVAGGAVRYMPSLRVADLTVPVITTSATATPAAHATVAGFVAPNLFGAAKPATAATSTGFGAAGLSTSSRTTPASRATVAAFPAPAAGAGTTVLAVRLATAATVAAPGARTGSTATAATWATSAAPQVPRLAGVARPATLARPVAFGAPSLSTGTRPVTVPLATTTAFGAVAVARTATVLAARLATSVWIPAPSANSDQTASLISCGTATAFGTPVVRTGTAPTPATRPTAAGFGAVELLRTAGARPATLATSSAVPAPGLSVVAVTGTIPTVVGFSPPPAIRTTALVLAPAAFASYSTVLAPRPSASSTISVPAATTSSSFGVPKPGAGAGARPATHATGSTFGAAVSSGVRLAPARLATVAVVGVVGVRASSTVVGHTAATSTGFGALRLSSLARPVTLGTVAVVRPAQAGGGAGARPVTLATATVFGAVAPSTGSRVRRQSLHTATTFGVASLATGGAARPTTLSTVVVVEVPKRIRAASTASPATFPTTTTFGVPGTRRSAGALPVGHSTVAGFPAPVVRGGAGAGGGVSTSTGFGAPLVSVVTYAAAGTVTTTAFVSVPVTSTGSTLVVGAIATVTVVPDAGVDVIGDTPVIECAASAAGALEVEASHSPEVAAAAGYAATVALEAARAAAVAAAGGGMRELAVEVVLDLPDVPLRASSGDVEVLVGPGGEPMLRASAPE